MGVSIWRHCTIVFTRHAVALKALEAMADKSTPESKVMQSSTAGLITHLTANNPVNVADALLSAELLTHDTYSKFLLPTYTQEMVAREITVAVTVKVKADPNNFKKFIDVLRSKGLEKAVKLLDDNFLGE